jgi:hypothetical protein
LTTKNKLGRLKSWDKCLSFLKIGERKRHANGVSYGEMVEEYQLFIYDPLVLKNS